MALRIAPSVRSGTLDFTVRGLVTGHLDLVGRDEPVLLYLDGLPWPDLAGHRLSFGRMEQKDDVPAHEAFQSKQKGTVGDMTASRKVKIPDRPIEEWLAVPAAERQFSWENCLYLEWYSQTNGRVVLESTDFELSIGPVAAWHMGPDDRPGGPGAGTFPFSLDAVPFDDYLAPEDETPMSETELEADREAARMDLLLDRISRRMDLEGDDADFEQIMEEEGERLRRERGEPEAEPLTPEQEEEQARWIEELNAASLEAENQPGFLEEEEDHPLVERTTSLGTALWKELLESVERKQALSPEHPFVEITDGVTFAGVKLAGALHSSLRRDEWPPDPLFAGDSLVRLKKARGHLHDALAGLRAAESDGLLGGVRLDEIDREIREILAAVEVLIVEVRGVFE